MSAIIKSHKAFDEEHDVAPYYLPRSHDDILSRSATYSDIQSESRWSVAVSDWSTFGRGIGAGREIHASSSKMLKKDLEAMLGGDTDYVSRRHTQEMEQYLLRLSEFLPQDSRVTIAVWNEDVVAVRDRFSWFFDNLVKFFIVSATLLTLGWALFLFRIFGFEYPDLFPYGLVALIAAIVVVVLAL